MKDFIYANKNLDPESCPIEDLENEVKRLKDLSGYFDSKQDGEKNFINAVYGAIANSYFIGHILDVAESITLQGQDLNHYSENKVNEYFSGVFQNDTNLHKELGIDTEIAKKFNISLGRTTDNGPVPDKPEYAHIIGNQTLTVAGDTDSAPANVNVYDNNNLQRFDDLFDKLKYENHDIVLKTENGSEIVPVKNHTTKTFDDVLKKVVDRPIKYIMRHKVSKSQWRLRTKSGKEITVTGDHSLMVLRNNKLISIKAKDVNKETDKIITIFKK